jgi:hypothetical protein
MSSELKEFQAEQREQLQSLDRAIRESDEARRKRSEDFLDWAIRRAVPNPKFDEEWKL